MLVSYANISPLFSNHGHALYCIFLNCTVGFFLKLHILDLQNSVHEVLKIDPFASIRPEIPVTSVELHKCFLLLFDLQTMTVLQAGRLAVWSKGGEGARSTSTTCPSAVRDSSRQGMSGLNREYSLFPIIRLFDPHPDMTRPSNQDIKKSVSPVFPPPTFKQILKGNTKISQALICWRKSTHCYKEKKIQEYINLKKRKQLHKTLITVKDK